MFRPYCYQSAFPKGPHKLALADLPYTPSALDSSSTEAPEAWGWWRRKDPTPAASPPGYSQPSSNPRGQQTEVIYEGIEKSLDEIAELIREEGPFDGVIGFSQGAALAVMVAALLEPGRSEDFARASGMEYPESFNGLMIPKPNDSTSHAAGEESKPLQPPFKFAIAYSGFRAPGSLYTAFYNPKIQTPVLHVLGAVDVVVEEARGRALVQVCESGNERVVVHPGGHFVPSQRVWVDAVVNFAKKSIEGSGGAGDCGKAEERVEDMAMPF